MAAAQNFPRSKKSPACRSEKGATSTPGRSQNKEHTFQEPMDIADRSTPGSANLTFRKDSEDSMSCSSDISVACGLSDTSSSSLLHSTRKRTKKFTTFEPFSFDSREHKKLLEKQDKSKEVVKKEEIPKFRARPMPKYPFTRRASSPARRKEE
ncbi:uncharacterized protein [Procambarus clarkii]|uniref:uncharacterized protein isoform X1 n=2 Tax=Procambarus clarkii TaxID=6728 RepID=UPI003743DE1A